MFTVLPTGYEYLKHCNREAELMFLGEKPFFSHQGPSCVSFKCSWAFSQISSFLSRGLLSALTHVFMHRKQAHDTHAYTHSLGPTLLSA